MTAAALPPARTARKVTTGSGACRSGRARSMPRWYWKAHPARERGSRSRRRWHEEEKVGSMSDPIRIMIVEDHAVVRQGLAALLRTVPDFSIVAEAADGRASVELFRQHQPDITLMDLRLPQMNGVEAITSIRNDFPQARIIVLTTFDGDEDIYRALQAGARGYLLKGMTGEELMDAIRSVYAGKSRIPPPAAER